ncbi:MAG: UDP-2,3-diacylglucosamine diphosphatase [Campylobacteraceae bacterium]|nr:UDP-2,3-diacylglucosamine diphosphatase [Campylobacteraceae bacterium]
MFLNLQESAIFIADAHFNEKRSEFLTILQKIHSREIVTTQIILMGDMFDFICSQSTFFVNKNSEVITLLNDLSQTIEIVYLEGNHDYNLSKLFPKISVFPREKQPIFANLGDKTVALNHGDLFVNRGYEIYCKIIRNKALLSFLNLIDVNFWLTKKINNHLLGKKICHKIDHFEDLAKKRSSYFDEDILIEGHFHQGNQYNFANKKYINIPSLTCSKKYAVVKNNLISNISFY